MNPDNPGSPLYYGEFRLDNVYGKMTPGLAAEIIALWQENGVVVGEEAQRRTAEVVLTVRDKSGILVGVNSVYVQNFIKMGCPYYFYRVFIRPQDSRSYGLRSFAGKAAREFLRNHEPATPPKPLGVVIVVENRKLMRPGARRMLTRQGWTPLGRGPRGFEVWCENFDGSIPATINPPA